MSPLAGRDMPFQGVFGVSAGLSKSDSASLDHRGLSVDRDIQVGATAGLGSLGVQSAV
jgi:hypothetical protein